jgi:biopolymer transport protein ExbD
MFGIGRRGRQHSMESVNMPITPMLDMTFQLLFFFILNYHPPTSEGEINYNLPAPDETAAASQIDNPKPSGDDSEEELKSNADLTVLVRTQHDGKNDGLISEVRVREERPGGQETTVSVEDGKLDKLITFLKNTRPNLANQDDIFIQGDSRLKWSGMIYVMDACRKAGFPNVGFKEPGDK